MYPDRIVCLTEETTETLYLLGEQARIVGISGFTVRPVQARQEKPRVSAFTSANIGKILALRPDLVLGFSDLQADICAQLVRKGVAVHIFNQRSCTEILQMILVLGGMIGVHAKAQQLAAQLSARLDAVRAAAAQFPSRPRVYFEEWDSPMISAIRWVSELIGIAGGDDCFPELAAQPLGRDRIIASALEVAQRSPDIIFGSWCGKKFKPAIVASRPEFADVPAVRSNAIYEIKSPLILQPGPAALSEGLDALHAHIRDWVQTRDQRVSRRSASQ